MKEAKLVICDIDNTLVVKHQPLSEYSRNVIAKLKEKGILFGMASGRPVEHLHFLEEDWNVECDILIGMNGSELYDGIDGTMETYYRLEPEWIKECFEIMSPFDSNPTMVVGERYYVGRIDAKTSSSKSYVKKQREPHVVDSYEEFWTQPAVKIGFRVSADDMPAIEERAAKFPSPNYIGFKTENTMFEFCHIKSSKGALLKAFCEKHEINIENVYAFGDMTNDNSMLEVAGVGVCMLNGSDDTKAIADVITDKGVEEDGFADFVEKNIL